MPEIYGFTVDGTDYQYDYESLANKPDDARLLPLMGCGIEAGFGLFVGADGDPVWRDPGEGGSSIPEYDETDADKVLAVNRYGSDIYWKEFGKELPSYDGDDVKKVLAVNDDGSGIEWIDTGAYVPMSDTSDENKILTVDNSGNPIWLDPIAELPDHDETDAGRVLTIDTSGIPAWMDPAFSLPSYDGTTDIGKVLMIGNDGSLIWDNP